MLLTHLTFVITWCPSSVVRINPFKFKSPLKPLNQIKPYLAWKILVWSPFTIVSAIPLSIQDG